MHVGAEGVDGVADTEVVELGDAEGTFGFVKKADVFLASLPCQLDWME